MEEAARRRAEVENRIRKYREQEVRSFYRAYQAAGNLKTNKQKSKD